MRKYIVGLLVVILLSGTVVYAANYLYHANEVSYTSDNKNWDVDNVKDALDDLYSKIDSGVAVCSSSTSTPIFKYEAAGVEDDYVYECKDGQWEKFVLAGKRWDGYFFNKGVFDAERFTPTWNINKYAYTPVNSNVSSSVTVTNQINAQYKGLYNTYSYYTNVNGGSGVGVEYIMPIPIKGLGAGKIRITFGASTTNDTAALYDFALKSSATPNGTNAFKHLWNQEAWTNVVVSSGRSSDFGSNKIVDLPISASLSNQDLYLAMQIGGLSNNTNSITVSIESIQFIAD